MATLADLTVHLKKNKTFHYVYDFGDDGLHTVKLEAVADPDHEDHDDMIDWRGPGFDPGTVDKPVIQKALNKLANRRKRKAKATP